MSRRAILMAVGALVVTALAALAFVSFGGREAEPAAQFAFAPATIELPADTATLPAGPHRELVEANCTACHSTEMLTTQPPLKPAQWAATVKKMREVYKAPVAPADDAAIGAYLTALNAPEPAAPQASSPASTRR